MFTRNESVFTVLAVLVSALTLVACGSSSSSDSSNTTTTSSTASFRAFPPGYFSKDYSLTYHLTGSSSGGANLKATVTRATGSQTTFSDQPAIPVQTSLQITNTSNGAIVTTTSTNYFTTDSTSRMLLGSTGVSTGKYTATSLNTIPQTATIGDGGTIGTYQGTGDALGRTKTATWELANANNGLAKLIITTSIYKNGTLWASQKNTSVIDQQGHRKSLKVETFAASTGLTITLKGKPVR